MARKDKKNRTCNRCGHTLATPQMLRVHLNQKNPCQPKNVIPIPTPSVQVSNTLPQSASPRANKQKVVISPQRTRLTINKRPDESDKEWATRLADRSDKVNGTK